MGTELYLNSLVGLLFVIGLIFLCAFFAKKYGLNANVSGIMNNRLKVISSKVLDIKTKVVLLQSDNVEYLILVTAQGAEILNKKEVCNNVTLAEDSCKSKEKNEAKHA